MGTKTLKTDPFELSPDLNFDDFDTDGLGIDEPKAKSRNPVTDVVKGTFSGIGSTVTNPSFLAKTTRSILPKEYGHIPDRATEVVKTVTSLYDETSREIKPQLAGLARKVDKIVPAEAGILKKATSKVAGWFGNENENDYGSSTESREDATITASLNDIFAKQQEANVEAEARDKAEGRIKTFIDQKRFTASNKLFQVIADNTTRLADYQDKITQAFQKKSLELQFRSYFVQAELLKQFNEFKEVSKAQGKAITHNTALSDYAKQRFTEEFMKTKRDKFISSFQSGLFGDDEYMKKVSKRLREKVMGAVDRFKSGLEVGMMGIDSAQQAMEMNKSLQESGIETDSGWKMAGDAIGGDIAKSYGEKGAKWLKSKLPENGNVVKAVYKGAEFAKNLPGYMAGAADNLRETKFYKDNEHDDGFNGLLANLAMGAADLFRASGPDMSLDKKYSGKEGDAEQFDNRAHRSLVEIIPGYLARILREQMIFRTGNVGMGLVHYDIERETFIEPDAAKKKVSSKIDEAFQSWSHATDLDEATKMLIGNKPVTEAEFNQVRDFVRDLAEKQASYKPSDIRKSRAFENQDESLKALIDSALTSRFEESETKEKDQFLFTSSIQKVRGSNADARKTIEKLVKEGHVDDLVEMKIITRDDDGGYTIDYDEYKRRIKEASGTKERFDSPTFPSDPATTITSDINAKSNLKFLDPRNALEGLKKTKLYSWFYKNGRGEDNPTIDWAAPKGKMLTTRQAQQKVGPMAQDVQKNLGDEAAPEGKSIDLVNMNGNMMGAIQELSKRQEQMIRSDSNKSNIQAIANNTREMADRLKAMEEKGGFGFGFGMPNIDLSKLRPNGGYIDNIANLGKDTFDLLTRTGKDFFKGGKKTYELARDNVVKPGYKMAKKGFNAAKDPVKDGAKMLFSKALSMGSTAIDFSKKLITDHVPTALGKMKDWAIKTKDFIKDAIRENTDIYIKGQPQPALEKRLMEAGHYFDKETGNIIKSFEDIKGTVVDKAGNIVLDVKDFAKGLYDINGEELVNPFIKAARNSFQRVMKAGQAAWQLGKGLFDKAKDKLSGMNMPNWSNWSLPGGFDIGFGKSYEVLTEIRDILKYKMLGGKDLPAKFRTSKDDKPKKSLGEFVEEKTAKAKDLVDKARAEATKIADNLKKKIDEKAPGKREELLKKANEAKDKAKAMWADKKGTLKSAKDKAYSMLGEKGQKHFATASEKLGKIGQFFKKKKGEVEEVLEPELEMKDKIDWGAKKGEMATRKSKPKVAKAIEAVEEVKEKGKNRLGDALNAARDALPGLKAKGLGKLGFLSALLPGKKKDEEPKEEKKTKKTKKKSEDTEAEKSEEKEGILDKLKAKARKGRDTLKAAWNDRNGDGKRDGNWEERLAKEEADEKARKAKSNIKADLDPKYVAEKGVLASIFGLFKGAMGLFTSGIGGVFNIAKNILGTIGAPLKKLVDLGKATRIGAMASRVASVVRVGAIVGGLMTGGTGGALLAAGGAIATGIGAILSSKVVLGGLALYGAYKAYKYFTRDKVDDFTRIRLYQYGLTNKDEMYNHKLTQLEDYLLEDKVGFSQGKAFLLEKKIIPNDVLDIMGIDPKNEEYVNRFSQWFSGRFKPFFLNACTILYGINNKVKLNKIEDCKPEQIVQFLEAAAYESGPYDKIVSPFKAIPELSDRTQPVIDLIKKLTDEWKVKIKVKDEKDKKPVKAPEKTPKALDDAPKPILPDQNKSNAPIPQNEQAISDDAGQNKLNKDNPAKDVSVRGTSLKEAGGPIASGESGAQYIKLGPDAKIDGMNQMLLKNLYGMAEEFYQKTGKMIVINSGKRSYEEQMALYQSNPEKAAKPGKSLHEFGLALDIPSVYTDQLENLGLMRKYGFTRPVGKEPWHTEPAGIQVNLKQAKDSPGFADQAIEASLYKGGGGYGTMSDSVKGKRNSSLAVSLLNVDASKAPTGDQAANDPTMDALKPSGPKDVDQTLDSKKVVSMSSYRGSVGKDKVGTEDTQKALDQNHEKMAEERKESAKLSTAIKRDEGFKQASFAPPPDYESKPATVSDSGAKPVGGTNPTSKEEVKQVIIDAANKTGVDSTTMLATAAVESSLNPNARASGTSATGLFGIIKGTWDELMSKNANKYGLDPNTPPTNARANALMGGEYIKSNQRVLKSVKSAPNLTDNYLAHFTGPYGAKKLFAAGPNAIAADVLPEAAAKNKAVFYQNGRALTVAELYSRIGTKLSTVASQYGITGVATQMADSGSPTATSQAPQSNGNVVKASFSPSATPSRSEPSATDTPPAPKVQEAPAKPRPSVFSAPAASAPVQSSVKDQGSANGFAPMLTELKSVNNALSKIVDIQTKALEIHTKTLDAINGIKTTTESKKDDNQVKPTGTQRPATSVKAMGEPSLDIARRA